MSLVLRLQMWFRAVQDFGTIILIGGYAKKRHHIQEIVEVRRKWGDLAVFRHHQKPCCILLLSEKYYVVSSISFSILNFKEEDECLSISLMIDNNSIESVEDAISGRILSLAINESTGPFNRIVV